MTKQLADSSSDTGVFSGNTSLEDLDEFSERFIDQEVTTQGPAEDGGADDHNGASLPVCLVSPDILRLNRVQSQLRYLRNLQFNQVS